MNLKILFLSCAFFAHSCFSKVLLFTYSYNRPDFITLQHKTFKKFLQDEYEFIVFNDARDKKMKKAIKETCASLGIRCIRIPQNIHDKPYLHRMPHENYHAPAVRNCNVVQYSLDTLGFDHDDILVLLDSDMFLIKDMSIRDYMHGYDIAGIDQERNGCHYLWIGLVFMDMAKMPNKKTINFNCGQINGTPVDAGGYTHYYLKNNPTARVGYIDTMYTHLVPQNTEALKKDGFSAPFIQFILRDPGMQFHLNCAFLHHGAGTNWCGSPSVQLAHKKLCLDEFINALVQ